MTIRDIEFKLGLGTRMFREMIKIAQSNPRIMQMEPDFIKNQSGVCVPNMYFSEYQRVYTL